MTFLHVKEVIFLKKSIEDEQDTVRNEILSYSGRTIKKTLKSEFRLLHEEGYYIDVEADIISINEHSFSKDENELLLVVMRDISERKEAEKAIYQLAFHDSLTNLPNRRSFMNQLRMKSWIENSPGLNCLYFLLIWINFKSN